VRFLLKYKNSLIKARSENFAPLQMSAKAKAKAALHAEVMDARANMGTYLGLGKVPKFKKIQQKALKLGLWVCSCMVCPNPVKDMTDFRQGGSGFEGSCKDCRNKMQRAWGDGTASEAREANEQHKEDISAKIDSTETKDPSGKTEDEVMKNFLVPLLSQFFEFIVMPEFRSSDAIAKCPNGKYIRIQLKTDGAFHKDGSPKPDNRKCKGDVGRGSYSHASGYEGMLVILIKSRLVGEIIKRYIWVAPGSKITQGSKIDENTDGTLGPQKIPQVDVQGLIDTIREIMKHEEYHVSLMDAWLDVSDINQFKEVAIIQALQTVYKNVDVPRQNQQAFDCFFDQRRIQVKTHNVKSGLAHLCHCKNGHGAQPYDSKDPIDAFCFGCIFRYPVQTCDGIVYCYFMLYCEIPMDVLIKNKMVTGATRGKTALCLHPGVFEQMLTGRTKKTLERTAWLDDYPFKCVRLHEHTEQNPQVHKLTKEMLEKVAQDIADPDAAPECMFE